MQFRRYLADDRERCLQLFDLNCPVSFAPNERVDDERFLNDALEKYELCQIDGEIVGGYGLYPDGPGRLAVRWITVSPKTQGQGIGSAMMTRIIGILRQSGGATLRIAASHKTAPFFEKFGARERDRIPDGWGPRMHRVEMVLVP